MAAWPSTLPNVQPTALRIAPKEKVLRTDMDSGYVRMRRRFRSVPTIYEVQWLMSQAEFGIFEGWFDSVIASGAEAFDISLPNGQGTSTMSARFNGMWSSQMANCESYYTVTAQLLVSNRPISVSMATEAGDTVVTEASDTIILE